jgi:hypothetical protein
MEIWLWEKLIALPMPRKATSDLRRREDIIITSQGITRR